jgi:outer membrane protein
MDEMNSAVKTVKYAMFVGGRPGLSFYVDLTRSMLLMVIVFGINLELVAQDPVKINLREAIQHALENNTDISIAKYQVSGSGYSVSESKGNYLPKVTLYGTYNRNIDKQVIFLPEGLGLGGATEIGSDNNFSAYVDFSIPLYSRSNLANREYAQHNFQLMGEILRGTRQLTIMNVKKSYFAHLAALSAVTVREKGLENALENLRFTQGKLDEGVATEFDKASAEVRVTVARNNLLESRSRVVPTANNLKLVLGLPIESGIQLTDSLTLSESEIFFSDGLDRLLHNSTLKQSELRVMAARQQVSVLRAVYFPVVTAVGTYQYQSQENDFNLSRYDWIKTSAVGLRLQVSLFNGTVTRNKVQQALMAEKIAEAQKEYASRNSQSQLQQLLSQLNYAKQRVVLQSENVAITENALALVKERYNYGRGTFLEVNNAELEYTTARLSYLQAVLDYKYTYYDFELLIGIEN